MFTGKIEDFCEVKKIVDNLSGSQFFIASPKITKDLIKSEQVLLNGVKVNVSGISRKVFTVDVSEDILRKTNISDITVGSRVNIERAMTLTSRLGGHLLTGFPESVGVIVDREIIKNGAYLIVGIGLDWMRFCIPKGPIALDGISANISSIKANFITVFLNSQLLSNTTLGQKKPGESLNIETDIIGKYIERLLIYAEEEDMHDEMYQRGVLNWSFGES